MIRHYRFDKATGKVVEFATAQDTGPVSAHVWHDLKEYRSPIDGRLIRGRVQRREDLMRSGCSEYDGPKDIIAAKTPR